MKISTINLSSILCLVFVVLQSVAIIPNSYLNHLVFALWLFILFTTYQKVLVQILLQTKYLLLFVFVLFFFCSAMFAASTSIAFHRTVSLLEVLSPILMFDISKSTVKAVPLKILYFSFSIVLVVNAVIAYQTIELTQGYGLRLTATDITVKNNFAFVYSLSMLCPVMFYILLSRFKRNKLKHIISVIEIICIVVALFFSIWLVFQSFFMTAILLLLLGMIMALFYGKKFWFVKSSFMVLVLTILFVGAFDSLVLLSDSYEGFSSQISPKLHEIHAIIMEQSKHADDFNTRQGLSASSIDTFLDNPIFGVYHKAFDFEEIERLGVGNHAEWADILARYGVFGFILLFFLFKSFWQSYRLSNFGLHLILFILLGFLNPLLNFFNLFTVFVYIPFLYNNLLKYEK